jgi:hypothetical protein
MLTWRQQTVANLAANPESWVRLGGLFAGVEESIPPHLALRRSSRINGRGDSPIDVGLHTARWRLFISYVRPLIERQDDQGKNSRGNIPRLQRSDFIRLKPDTTACVDCGNKRYLSHWPSSNQKPAYTCPTCNNEVSVTNPQSNGNGVNLDKVAALINGCREAEAATYAAQVPPIPPEIIQAPPEKSTLPRAGAARRKRAPKVYPEAPPKLLTPPVLPPPAPLPKVKEVVEVTPSSITKYRRPRLKPSRDPFEDAWFHILTHLEHGQRGNQKLHRAMRYTFEMGLINEYKQMFWNKIHEIKILGYPNDALLTMETLKIRAINWVNLENNVGKKILPMDLKRRTQWVPRLLEAYSIASLAVLEVGFDGKLGDITAVIEELHKRHNPPLKITVQKQAKEVRQRWGSPMKGVKQVISRWFMR